MRRRVMGQYIWDDWGAGMNILAGVAWFWLIPKLVYPSNLFEKRGCFLPKIWRFTLNHGGCNENRWMDLRCWRPQGTTSRVHWDRTALGRVLESKVPKNYEGQLAGPTATGPLTCWYPFRIFWHLLAFVPYMPSGHGRWSWTFKSWCQRRGCRQLCLWDGWGVGGRGDPFWLCLQSWVVDFPWVQRCPEVEFMWHICGIISFMSASKCAWDPAFFDVGSWGIMGIESAMIRRKNNMDQQQ